MVVYRLSRSSVACESPADFRGRWLLKPPLCSSRVDDGVDQFRSLGLRGVDEGAGQIMDPLRDPNYGMLDHSLDYHYQP